MLNVDQVEFRGEGEYIGTMSGDLTIDWQLSFSDAALMYQYILGETVLSEQAAANADFNFDGSVSMLDVADLYQCIIGS